MKQLILITSLVLYSVQLAAQCCAGASPVSNSGSFQVGLKKHQFEVSSQFQYSYGDETYSGDTATAFKIVQKEHSSFIFSTIGYGLSDKLSIYGSVGYYLHKTEELPLDTFVGTGVSDLVLLPRYQVLSVKNANNYNELAVSLGMKIPIGDYALDRVVYTNPNTGEEIRFRNPVSTQPSTGSNDFIFDTYFFRSFNKLKLNLTANANYILRGSNPVGQVFGDIATVSAGLTKQLFKGASLALEVRTQKIDSIIDPDFPTSQKNTGLKKLSLVPSLYLSPVKGLTIAASLDYAAYQYVKGSQPIVQYIALAGIIYRFSVARKKEEVPKPEAGE